MKGSVIIVGCFLLGLGLSVMNLLPRFILTHDISKVVLFVLLSLIGISLGLNNKLVMVLRNFNWRIALVPCGCIIGTYIGVAFVSLLFKDIGIKDALAVGSGMGYYSISSVILKELRGETLSIIALLSNIIRELTTLLFAPIMVRYFGKLAPILSGGATSMDTTLPIITQYSGREFVLIALFNGTVLSILVPILVSFFAS